MLRHSPHHTHARCGETSDFCHVEKFEITQYVEKCQISPHLHNVDKFEITPHVEKFQISPHLSFI